MCTYSFVQFVGIVSMYFHCGLHGIFFTTNL